MIPSNAYIFLNAYEKYGSIKAAAKALHVSHGTMRKMLISAGAYSSPISEEIAELREKGFSNAAIAEMLEISPACVVSNSPYVKNSYLNPDKSEKALYLRDWKAKKKQRP